MKAISTLFSIGHGRKTKDEFLFELKSFDIQFVVDVRSCPFSKWAERFNRGNNEEWLSSANIRYVYFGDFIGGRPPDSNPKKLQNRMTNKCRFWAGDILTSSPV